MKLFNTKYKIQRKNIYLIIIIFLSVFVLYSIYKIDNMRNAHNKRITVEATYVTLGVSIAPATTESKYTIVEDTSGNIFSIKTVEGYYFLIQQSGEDFHFVCRSMDDNHCNAAGYIDMGKQEFGGSLYLKDTDKSFKVTDVTIMTITPAEHRLIIDANI